MQFAAMYTRYQGIKVITFLYSILLQGCSDMGLKMADEEVLKHLTEHPHPRSETKTREHSKFPEQRSDQRVPEVSGEFGVASLPDCPEARALVLRSSSHALPRARVRQTAVSTVSQSMQAMVSQSASDTPVAPTLTIRTQSVQGTQLSSLSRGTTFSTLAAAQEAVSAYLIRWRLETPSGRATIREQGHAILKGVEGLKRAKKRSYRRQVLGFETQDIDPLVWNRLLQTQQTTQAQLNALRGLRTQLLDTCQFDGQDLPLAGIRTITGEAEEEVGLYSSDEDTQELSDQERKNHAAFVVGVGKVLKKHLEKELLTLLENAVKTKVVPRTTFSSTPELPELLKAYVDSLKQEADEERSAELLGSLLTEAILQSFSLSKAKKAQLYKLKQAIGQAAYKVVLHYDPSQDPGKASGVSRHKPTS